MSTSEGQVPTSHSRSSLLRRAFSFYATLKQPSAIGGSGLNLVEVWFGIIEHQAIHRGTFTSVKDLNAKIRAFVDGWNPRKHSFTWTKTAEQVLARADPPHRDKASATRQ